MAAVENCIEEGGERRACRERYSEAFEGCVQRVCADEEEGDGEELDACEDRCRTRAMAAFENCIEAGGERAACREQYSEAFELCVERACIDEEEGGGEEIDACESISNLLKSLK